MSRRIIKLKDIDPLLFAGVGDENLKALRRHSEAQIYARGNKLTLEGDETEVDRLAVLIHKLVSMIESGRLISPAVVDAEVSGLKSVAKKSERESGVIYTPRKVIRPQSAHQESYVKSIEENAVAFAIGPAGTGKTYLAVAKGVEVLSNSAIDRIILTRPAVEAGESLGFLPGDLKEKVDPYLRPLYDALSDMIPAERMRRFFDNQVIEIAPLAFMRGRTLSDAYIILDEAQNTTPPQMMMFLTRLGWNSHAIITGDVTQIDLDRTSKSGLLDARDVLSGVEGINFVEFDASDVVRPPLVSQIIQAYEKNNST